MVSKEWENLWELAKPYLDFIVKEMRKVILVYDFPGYSDEVYIDEVYRVCIYPFRKLEENPDMSPVIVKKHLAKAIWRWAKSKPFRSPGTPQNVKSLNEDVELTNAKGNPSTVKIQVPSDANNPDSELICKEQLQYTAKIVAELSDYEKEILYERVSKKTSYKKLGKKVGESDGTVWGKCKQLALTLKDEFYKIDYMTKGNKLAEVL